MCGIAGKVGGAPPESAALGAMAATMAHRGPDGEGVWHDAEAGLAFRRLAIIDLDERSDQPLHLGALHLVFNGEIYNYVELREELRGLGHAFETEGDGEVLLHAWSQWGEGALARLDGMYAFAVWDAAKDALTLVTDAFAEKPLFFADRPGGEVLFASDVRALRAAAPELGAPDEEAARAFAALGVLPTLPRTFYAGVRRLPGAHLARVRDGVVELHRYWDPEPVEVPATIGAAAEELRGLLAGSVRRRLRSDVAVGTSLSGGVDSAVVATLCAEIAPEADRQAFTAAFEGFDRDEWDRAALAAEAAQVTRHHAVRPSASELLDDLSALVRDQEEPFPTTSIYAQWRVARAAREAGVTVLLDGQGADELLAGYGWTAHFAAVGGGPRAMARSMRFGGAGAAAGIGKAVVAERLPGVVARRHRLATASPYVSSAVAREAAVAGAPGPVPSPVDGGPLRRELLRQSYRDVLPQLLRFADRDSMAHSVEVRLPFLDREVARFALSLPPAWLVSGGVSKRVLRRAFRGTVPDAILDRRDKVGFETPQDRWFGAPGARETLAEIVLDPGALTAGWLDRTALEHDARDGWRDTRRLWWVVNAELWMREVQSATLVA